MSGEHDTTSAVPGQVKIRRTKVDLGLNLLSPIPKARYLLQRPAHEESTYADIPDVIKQMRIWLPCHLIKDAETGKIKKIPYHYKTGSPIYTKDGEWVTTNFATAVAVARKRGGGGVGIQLGKGVVAFDLDACVKGATFHPWAEEALARLDGAYVEMSVSGTGAKAYLLCVEPPAGRPRTESLGEGEVHDQHIMYLGSAFAHITGASIRPGRWEPWSADAVTEAAKDVGVDLSPRKEAPARPSVYHSGDPEKDGALAADCLGRIPNDKLDWEWWNEIGMATWAAFQGSEAGGKVFAEWSAKNPNNNPRATAERWRHWSRHPPSKLTVGRLVQEAKKADPLFDPPRPRRTVAPRQVTEWGDIRIDDLHLNAIIEGILFEGSLAVVYGAFGSGKSFYAVYIAVCVSLGREFFRRKVQPCNVLYIAAEAENSIKRRFKAYEIEEPGTVATPGRKKVHVMAPPIDLFGDPDKRGVDGDWPEIEKFVASNDIGLVVVDTFAQALGAGNENLAQDTMRIVRFCNDLRHKTGACVLFVHHSGKNKAQGMRGGTALAAAAEEHVEVEEGRDDDGGVVRRASLVRSKDTAGDQVMHFDLTPVELALTYEGSVITSCVVAPRLEAPDVFKGRASGGAPPISKPGPRPGEPRRVDLLRNIVRDQGPDGVERKVLKELLEKKLGVSLRADSYRRLIMTAKDERLVDEDQNRFFLPAPPKNS